MAPALPSEAKELRLAKLQLHTATCLYLVWVFSQIQSHLLFIAILQLGKLRPGEARLSETDWERS